jgi:hypothetical protein
MRFQEGCVAQGYPELLWNDLGPDFLCDPDSTSEAFHAKIPLNQAWHTDWDPSRAIDARPRVCYRNSSEEEFPNIEFTALTALQEGA